MRIDAARSAHHVAIAIFFSGIFLILAGTTQIFMQDANPAALQVRQSQGINVQRDGAGSFGITSRYPGVTMIALGLLMELGAGTLLLLLARTEVAPSRSADKN